MIRHEITLHTNYQIKSFTEFSDNIITTQEFYNKKGQPIKTHIKDNQHLVYKNGILKKTIKFYDTTLIKFIEESKNKFHYITEFYPHGTIRRKAKFKYTTKTIYGEDDVIEYSTKKHILEGIDIHYTADGHITQKDIYKNGKLHNRLFVYYYKGEYVRLIYEDVYESSTQIIRKKTTKPITPHMLNKFAPNWNDTYKDYYIGQPCEFLPYPPEALSGCGVITNIISWYQVEVTDELHRKLIIPIIYVSINSI